MFEFNFITLFKCVARDVALDPFTTSYCIKRLRKEGIQFWTVTLPGLSKAVLASIEKGHFDRPTSIAWKGNTLLYFRRFLHKIFDYKTGNVLEEVDPVALWQLRQICEYAYKLSLEPDESSLHQSEAKFKKNDAEVGALSLDGDFVNQIRKDFETHYSSISRSTVHDVYREFKPRSGPGTFSEKSIFQNVTHQPWFLRKEYDYRAPREFLGLGGLIKPYPSASPVEVCADDPNYSEVLFVPKDSRGPRVIVREPFALLRQQMAFNSFLAHRLERVSDRRINFQDQQVNQKLACSASVDRKNATLDLKDASDRVSARLCASVFRNSPAMRYFISRRSLITKLPSGDFWELHKLSGMGSGLTFPVMSLLIHLAISRSVVDHTLYTYEYVRKRIYVYGDDIIVPSMWVDYAMRGLNKIGLLVNSDKSFRRSFFRESCGGDYYRGQAVSPVRLKLSGCELAVSSCTLKLSVSGQLSFLNCERHARELVKNGLMVTAGYFYSIIEKRYGKLPVVSGESPVLGRYSILPPKYEQDTTGAYVKVRCRLPVARTIQSLGRDPTVYFSKLFARSQASKLSSLLFPEEGSKFECVAEPRTVKYQHICVSAFRLMA